MSWWRRAKRAVKKVGRRVKRYFTGRKPKPKPKPKPTPKKEISGSRPGIGEKGEASKGMKDYLRKRKIPTSTGREVKKEKGITEKVSGRVATIGLKPSEYLAKGAEKLGLTKEKPLTAKELASTPTGKVLGLVTAGASVVATMMGVGAAAGAAATAKASGYIYTTGVTGAGAAAGSWGAKSMVTKLLIGAGITTFGISIAKDVLSQVIFSGFIGTEESVQTIGFAYNQAIQDGNLEEAQKALDEELRLLEYAKTLKGKLPWENSIVAIDEFAKAAAVANAIKQKLLDDKISAIENNDTAADAWARAKAEEKEQEKVLIDYYNEQRKEMLEWERQAQKEARNEDAKFWRKKKEELIKLEEAERKAIADFWEAYRRKKIQDQIDNTPSNLNFGLLK